MPYYNMQKKPAAAEKKPAAADTRPTATPTSKRQRRVKPPAPTAPAAATPSADSATATSSDGDVFGFGDRAWALRQLTPAAPDGAEPAFAASSVDAAARDGAKPIFDDAPVAMPTSASVVCGPAQAAVIIIPPDNVMGKWDDGLYVMRKAGPFLSLDLFHGAKTVEEGGAKNVEEGGVIHVPLAD
jgi:hypothetical protein